MSSSDLWGYADLHCHPMAHLAFGGSQRLPIAGFISGSKMPSK
jgi:hypothetical protein